MKRLPSFCAVLVLACAQPALASEKSEALSARGLVELQKGNSKAAIDLFNQAIETDPNDAEAYYQRGAAYAKESEFEQAVPDLQKALALRPTMDEAALELGIALVELHRNDEARPWLQQAQKRPDLDGQASFFLGLANLRDNRLDEARSDFERARLKDPTVEVSARYYLGVVEYRAGNSDAAGEHFHFVEQQSPQSAVGRESSAFLELLRAGAAPTAQVYGAASLQYDTNVVLAPAQGFSVSGISGKADGRFTVNVGGVYVPWHNDSSRLSVGYDFYQNLQFHITEFNLMDNRPTVQFTHDFGPFRTGVLTQYDYYLLDAADFLQEVTALPYVVFPEPDIGRTELYLRFEWLDYIDQSFDQLSGYDYAGGVRQVIYLDEGREAWVSYEQDSMDTVHTKLYAYDANQVEVGLIWPLPWQVNMQIGYRFRFEEYANASLIFTPVGEPRRDNEHRAGLAFRKDLNSYLSVVAAWIGTFNLSNKDVFEYNRQIGSLGIEARY